LVSEKFPLDVMLATLIFTLLGLLMLIVCGLLVVPVPWEPKPSEAGATALNAALSITSIASEVESPAAKSGRPSPLKSPTVIVGEYP